MPASMPAKDGEPGRAEQIVYLTEWAARFGATLQTHGQVGFGRDATGILMGYHYPDTEDAKQETAYKHDGGPWWEPEDSYHKHDCLCVLGHGDDALRQLYDWVRWLDEHGYVIEEVPRQATSQIDLIFHGVSRPRVVKGDPLNGPDAELILEAHDLAERNYDL